MGRVPWSHRVMVEDCLVFSMDTMNRDGVFSRPPGSLITCVWRDGSGEEIASVGYWIGRNNSSDFTLRFSYTVSFGEESTPVSYTVETVTAPCGFVKFKRWFLCPLTIYGVPCRRRVSKLYLPPGARYFGCRQCYNLTYRSRKQHDKKMSFYRKLGYEDVMKGMRGGDMRAVREILRRIEGRNRREK